MTPRASWRTLVLLLELLVAVVSLQYVVSTRMAKADAVWLAGDSKTVIMPSPAAPDNQPFTS